MHRPSLSWSRIIVECKCGLSAPGSDILCMCMYMSTHAWGTEAAFADASAPKVIIGTHGRMKNWVSQRQLEIDNIVILVFDEADEMLKAEAFADDTGVCGCIRVCTHTCVCVSVMCGGAAARWRCFVGSVRRKERAFWRYPSVAPASPMPSQVCLLVSLYVCLAVRLIKTIRRRNPEVQLLLFSATYNDNIKQFAMRIAPNANQVSRGLPACSTALWGFVVCLWPGLGALVRSCTFLV